MIKHGLFATTALALVAFDSGKAGWKLDADGKIEMKDGNPIYVDADGREMVTESGTISRLNGEARGHRERAEKAEKALEIFKDLDPETARKAIETVSKIDAKKLIDAGEVDKVRDEISKSYTGQIAEKDAAIGSLQSHLDNLTLENAFSKSEFISKRVAVPADMFTSQFGKHFKIEDGKPVPYDASGNKIFSKSRVGETANVDEAFEIIVDGYAYKDTILKAHDAGGSGNGGGGGQRGGGRFVSRADFAKLSPADQATVAGQAQKGEVTLTD